MKQHITVNQLKELSVKGKNRLREWAVVKEVYWNYPENLPSLSIGQMIEFLDEEGRKGDLHFNPVTWPLYEASGMEWDSEGPMWGKPNVEELCDLLWEAVKEVLEK